MFRSEKFFGLTALLSLGLMIYTVRGQIGETIKEYDLLEVVLSDMEYINSGAVTYVEGTNGFNAFSIANSANLRSPYRLVLPEKLEEFAIMATVKTSRPPEGFLFSVVNSLDSVIQLGIKLAAAPNSHVNISLVYNDHSSQSPAESIASFTLPYAQKQWIKFAIQVQTDKITIYHDCIKTHEVNYTKEPKELAFESASTFYLAQAGNSRQKFEILTKPFKCHGKALDGSFPANPSTLPTKSFSSDRRK